MHKTGLWLSQAGFPSGDLIYENPASRAGKTDTKAGQPNESSSLEYYPEIQLTQQNGEVLLRSAG